MFREPRLAQKCPQYTPRIYPNTIYIYMITNLSSYIYFFRILLQYSTILTTIYLGFRRRADLLSASGRLFYVILVVKYLHLATAGSVFHVVHRPDFAVSFYFQFLVLDLQWIHGKRANAYKTRS